MIEEALILLGYFAAIFVGSHLISLALKKISKKFTNSVNTSPNNSDTSETTGCLMNQRKVARTKYLVAIAAALLFTLTLSTPAYGFDTPDQDTTANATDVVIWYGQNLTIDSVTGEFTITLDGFEDAMTAALEAQSDVLLQGLTVLVEYIVIFLLILVMAALGYWHRDRVLLAAAGFAFLLYGFYIWDNSNWLYAAISILTVIAGIYLIIKAFWDRRRGNASDI